MVCGAGLQSVIFGIQAILSKDSQMVIAGGAESASNSPYLIKREDVDFNKESVYTDSIANDGLFCNITSKRMGDLIEGLAQKYKIYRSIQDQYTLNQPSESC